MTGREYDIKSELKLSLFATASAANVNGTCRLLVTLADHPNLKSMELVEVDGVDFGCLKSAYEDVPDAYVALDALTALAQTSKAHPSFGDAFNVTLCDPSDESNSTHAVRATYSAYKALKVRLDKKNDDSVYDDRVTSSICGGMNNHRENGEKVNPAKTCPRVGVNREIKGRCKDKCLSSKTCNWKPWEYSNNTWGLTSPENCLDEDLGDKFCAVTNEVGGVEDITELGYCSPTTGIIDEYGGGWYSNEASSITD